MGSVGGEWTGRTRAGSGVSVPGLVRAETVGPVPSPQPTSGPGPAAAPEPTATKTTPVASRITESFRMEVRVAYYSLRGWYSPRPPPSDGSKIGNAVNRAWAWANGEGVVDLALKVEAWLRKSSATDELRYLGWGVAGVGQHVSRTITITTWQDLATTPGKFEKWAEAVEVVFAKEQRRLVRDEVSCQWLLDTNMTTAERAEENVKRLIEGDRPSRSQQILQEEKDCYDKWIAEYYTMVARGRGKEWLLAVERWFERLQEARKEFTEVMQGRNLALWKCEFIRREINSNHNSRLRDLYECGVLGVGGGLSRAEALLEIEKVVHGVVDEHFHNSRQSQHGNGSSNTPTTPTRVERVTRG